MLEKLRAKPDHFKKIFSLVFTIVVFSGIFFVWLSSLDARNTENETRDKTIAPLAGISAMLDGFQLSIKDMMSGAPTFVEKNNMPATSSALTVATTSGFDLSGVVVIDPAATATVKNKQ